MAAAAGGGRGRDSEGSKGARGVAHGPSGAFPDDERGRLEEELGGVPSSSYSSSFCFCFCLGGGHAEGEEERRR